jgi:hypothetical protein
MIFWKLKNNVVEKKTLLFVNHLGSTLCCIVVFDGIGNKCMRRNFIICSCHLILYRDYEGETSLSQPAICTGKYGLLVENTSTRISFERTRCRGDGGREGK